MRLLPLALLFFTLLPAAMPVLAADTCCVCERTGDPETTCITAPEESGQQFDPVTRTFHSVNTADACSGAWVNGQGLDGWTCTKEITTSQCKPIGTGAGVCQQGPTASINIKTQAASAPVTDIGASQSPPPPAIIPQLNTPIPGFAFTGGDSPTEETSSLLAQYISAAYRYGISITAIAATIMFVWGAFMYLVGSGLGDIQRGKTIMQEAILGMILVFGANMILRTLNPATLTFEALYITGIRPDRELEDVSTESYATITGASPISKQAMLALAKEKAAATGIPEMPCIIYASMAHESGGKTNAIGHDENFNVSTHGNVKSRRAFLESGVTATGKQFTPITCPGSNECFTAKQLNDDVINLGAAPDYGLDWRFSHGIGASQVTIFPDNKPCPGRESEGRGAVRGSKCFTVKDLLSPEGALDAMLAQYTACYKRAGGDVALTIACYGGRSDANSLPTKKRMGTYERCRAQ